MICSRLLLRNRNSSKESFVVHSLRRFAVSSSSSSATTPPLASPLASILERSSAASVSVTSEGLAVATSTSILSPIEKQEIFLRQSRELQTAMKDLMGEKESIRTTLSHARQQQNSTTNLGATTATTTADAGGTNASSRNNTQRTIDIIVTMSMSFVAAVLAAQVARSGKVYRKTLLQLEAAEEVINEQRELLLTIQNSNELQTLAKKITNTIGSENDINNHTNATGTVDSFTTSNTSTAPTKTKGRSWFARVSDPKQISDDDTNISFSEIPYSGSNNSSGGSIGSSNSSSPLEERIHQLLSNHVNNVVGDATCTAEELERRQLEGMVVNVSDTAQRQLQIQEQKTFTTTIPIEQQHQTDVVKLSEQQQEQLQQVLLDALLAEQQQQQQQNIEGNDGKRRVFQI